MTALAWGPVGALGAAQTLAWASSYYLPAVLAAPMARDLGFSLATAFAAFSLALVVSAGVGPWAGRLIDRHGGRRLLMATNGVFALGLLLLSQAQGVTGVMLAWAVIGVGMGAGLYEAAFATLVHWQGTAARRAITAITLIAGFASTVGWPLTSWMLAHWGWREAALAWAALHLLLGLPLNACLPCRLAHDPPRSAPEAEPSAAELKSAEPTARATPTGPVPPALPPADARRAAWLLSAVFTLTAFVSTAMAAHLPGVILATGVSAAVALTAASLMGPAQVLARVLEWRLLQRWHPMLAARLATLTHPLGAVLLLALGGPWALVFAVAHGAGNGIMTIAKGALPLALFGRDAYGARQGWLMAPARVPPLRSRQYSQPTMEKFSRFQPMPFTKAAS